MIKRVYILIRDKSYISLQSLLLGLVLSTFDVSCIFYLSIKWKRVKFDVL